MHMEKLLHTFTLKKITARPMGYVRFGLFFLTFLIARIPLWFIIVCAFLLNGTIGITYTLFLSFAVIMCNSRALRRNCRRQQKFSVFFRNAFA